jgi:NADPH2:quinone reductase
MPADLDAVEAAPLLCAGVTTYNALRNSHADAGDLVAIQGVGGLGHLGIQYARAAGFETVAVSRSADKRDPALELGADHFVDAAADDPAAALRELGGADVILATAPSATAMERVAGGLGVDGRLVAVGVPGDDVAVPIEEFVDGRQGVIAWASGTPRDSQDALEFAALRGITPTVETYPLEEAAEAHERMLANEARFRLVLEP